MSEQRITVGSAELVEKFYQGERVVTFEDIAAVHGGDSQTEQTRLLANTQKSYQRHVARFQEGKHVFRLDFAEANQLGLRVPANPNGLTLFTEKGYLLLVKPMRDDVSWQVQEQMVDDYFRLRKAEEAQQTSQPLSETDKLALLLGVEFPKIHKALEADQSDIQHNHAVFQDFERITTRRLDTLQNEKASQREVDDIRQTVESIATCAAGPYAPSEPERPPSKTVWEFICLAKKHCRLKGRIPSGYKEAFKDYMRRFYVCVDRGQPLHRWDGSCKYTDELWRTTDLEEAYISGADPRKAESARGFGSDQYRHLGGDAQLKAEIAHENHPLRSVKTPLRYSVGGSVGKEGRDASGQ